MSKKLKIATGAILVSIPFAGIMVMQIKSIGVAETMMVWGIVAVVLFLISVGVSLIVDL